MREYQDGTPPGTIAVPTSGVPRYHEFWLSLNALEVPAGTRLALCASCDVVANWNTIIREQFTGDWLWMMGDDHVFNPDILRRLLAHHVDVVAPLTPRKREPYLPVVWKDLNPDTGKFSLYSWHEISDFDGLTTVAGVGNAGMLVTRRVLDAIGDPWLKSGRLTTANLTEDTWFCWEATQRGFPIFVDPSLLMGHLATVALWPGHDADGRLHIVGNIGNVERVLMKAYNPRRPLEVPHRTLAEQYHEGALR